MDFVGIHDPSHIFKLDELPTIEIFNVPVCPF